MATSSCSWFSSRDVEASMSDAYLLEQPEVERVVSVGRNLARPEPFTLNVGKDDPRYSYHAYHITYEMDLLLELLDKVKPEVIVNYAAQGEGAVSWKHSSTGTSG